MSEKQLLVVAHVPSANTLRLVEAVLRGARNPDIDITSIERLNCSISPLCDHVVAQKAFVIR